MLKSFLCTCVASGFGTNEETKDDGYRCFCSLGGWVGIDADGDNMSVLENDSFSLIYLKSGGKNYVRKSKEIL